MHFEHLHGGPDGGESDVYQWFGPYVQFSDLGGKGYLRLSGGLGLVDDPSVASLNNSFYKLAVEINL